MWAKVYPPGTRRGRDRWIVRGKDRHGRSFEEQLPEKVKSEGAAEGYARRLLDAANRSPVAEPVAKAGRTFADAAEKYRIWRRPSKAEQGRIDKLVAWPSIGKAHVGTLGTDDVAEYATIAFPGCKASTLNREAVRPFAAVLHHVCDAGWRPYLRVKAFREKAVERVAAKMADVNKAIANVDMTGRYAKAAGKRKDGNAPYKAALLELLRLRGPRISDALKLKREEDLDLPGGRIRLTVSKSGDKVVWLPLNPKVVSLLANLAPCEGGYVFPWRTRFGVYKWQRPLCKRLGIKFTPHQLRHAMATEMLDAGVDLRTIQSAGAWASLNSVRPYLHPSDARLREADSLRPVGKRVGKNASR